MVGRTTLLHLWRDDLQVARVRDETVLCAMGGTPRALLGILPLSALQPIHYKTLKAGSEPVLGEAPSLLAASCPACALSSPSLLVKLKNEEAA